MLLHDTLQFAKTLKAKTKEDGNVNFFNGIVVIL